MDELLSWLIKNNGLAEWITATVAVLALLYTRKEFILKRRPFIDVEIAFADNPDKAVGGWLFFALLTNKGTYPGIVKVKKTIMQVGDEKYPSEVKQKFVVSPGESKKSALIGFIYKKGIQKILGHEYRKNRVEVKISVESSEIGEKEMKYLTEVTYEVNVSGDKPIFTLIEEKYT